MTISSQKRKTSLKSLIKFSLTKFSKVQGLVGSHREYDHLHISAERFIYLLHHPLISSQAGTMVNIGKSMNNI